MKSLICLTVLALAVTGCAGKTAYRDSCASQLNAAWEEQSIAEAEGFAGTVSYSKAMALLTGAKTQQQFARRALTALRWHLWRVPPLSPLGSDRPIGSAG
jgi:uncharacterized lipoprotein YbaY